MAAEPMDPSVPLLRVVKGNPSAEELAALTVVLLARAGRDGHVADQQQRRPAVARWHRLERALGFENPRAWQTALPVLPGRPVALAGR
jgi:hypothetical protein